MNSEGLLHKAGTALSSARLLLQSADADGACNLAYYAMFDAARAALMAFQKSDEVLTIKTHSGLISSFSLQLVKPGLIDIELGKALNKAKDLRLIADCKATRLHWEMLHGLSSKQRHSWQVSDRRSLIMKIDR